MEWLKAILKAAGLDDAAIEKMIGDVNKELPKHFVPKDKYNEASEAKKQAETALAERDKQLEKLKKDAGSNEELQQQIQKLQDENKATKDKYESELKDMKVNAAIEKALTTAKAKHPDLLAGKFDRSKIKLLEDGTITGVDEQIKPMQESYKDLFESTEQSNQFQFKGAKPFESGGSGEKQGVGSLFAKNANEGSKPSANIPNPWG